MNPPADLTSHESLCNNCGKCCYKKMIVGRTVFVTPFPCEYLNTETNLCTIYDRRHELNPECLSMERGFKVSAFPEDCPYVPVMAPKNYKPMREDWDWAGEWHDLDDLAEDLDVSRETLEKVRVRGPNRPMYAETYERIRKDKPQTVIWGDGAAKVVNMVDNAPVDKSPTLAGLIESLKSKSD